jgi:hypothetical protein
MPVRKNLEDLMREVDARQRNYVFPDTVRNAGGFWRGLYQQKLDRTQTIGFIVLIFFYVLMFIGLVIGSWPSGSASFWEKLLSGYWLYFLLSLPLCCFFLVMHLMLRRKSQIPPHKHLSP